MLGIHVIDRAGLIAVASDIEAGGKHRFFRMLTDKKEAESMVEEIRKELQRERITFFIDYNNDESPLRQTYHYLPKSGTYKVKVNRLRAAASALQIKDWSNIEGRIKRLKSDFDLLKQFATSAFPRKTKEIAAMDEISAMMNDL